MYRHTWGVLVLLLMVCAGCVTILPPEQGDLLLFFSDFEDDEVGGAPSGVHVYNGNPVISDHFGRKTVYMEHPNYETDYKGDSYYIAFEPQTGIVSLELWAYMTGTNRSLNIIFASDYEALNKYSTENCGVYLQFDRYGDLRALYMTEKQNWLKLADYEANTWYHLRVEVDVASNTYDVYLNNNLVGTDVPFYGEQSSLNSVFIRLAHLRAEPMPPVYPVHIDSIRIERK
ncbi:MAG TPA: LamG domain-containing protein [Firmicutes bacterium]|nr:LamG domain-containing protein [Bacillota bacterium]